MHKASLFEKNQSIFGIQILKPHDFKFKGAFFKNSSASSVLVICF